MTDRESSPELPSIWVLLRDGQYMAYTATRVLYTLAMQIVILALGWTLYARTGNPIFLGLAGLILFVPQVVFVLAVGVVIDRYRRQDVLLVAIVMIAMATVGLALSEHFGGQGVALALGLLVFVAIARAFPGAALRALLNNVVPRAQLPQAIAMNSSLTKLAVVAGPLMGGFLYAASPVLAYGIAAGTLFLAAAATRAIRQTNQSLDRPKMTRGDLLVGFGCIRHDPVLLGAMSLDLFAVFLGGVTALLPVYAVDVLGTTPVGLGILRAATAVGAVGVATWLAWRPFRGNVGRVMIGTVAAYGATILLFATSTNLWLSAFALMLSGGFDMFSVNIRQSLIQLRTPDAMRGRVEAIGSIFLGGSNELGDFRAATVAAIWGGVASATAGGVGAIGVALAWAKLFPDLRRADRLE